MPDNVDSSSENRNVIVLKGVSKQAAKEAKMKVKERAAILHEASKCFL
jgi:hypothetical protein